MAKKRHNKDEPEDERRKEELEEIFHEELVVDISSIESVGMPVSSHPMKIGKEKVHPES